MLLNKEQQALIKYNLTNRKKNVLNKLDVI